MAKHKANHVRRLRTPDADTANRAAAGAALFDALASTSTSAATSTWWAGLSRCRIRWLTCQGRAGDAW